MSKRNRQRSPYLTTGVSPPLPPWTPLVRSTMEPLGLLDRLDKLEALAREFGSSTTEARKTLDDIEKGDEIWINSRYQVNRRYYPAKVAGEPALVHLSIKRRDKAPIGAERYRDFMKIKDQLLSPEHEAMEIYPARSREIDTSTQYHLWAIDSPTWRVPFGWTEGRRVQGPVPNGTSGAVQNPFESHHPI